MYFVEVQVLKAEPSITYPLPEVAYPEWDTLAQVPPLETDQAELQEARELAEVARSYYQHVRITASAGGNGLRRIVQ